MFFLLRPLVAGRVVLEHRAGGRACQADGIAAEEIQLAAGDDAIAFFIRLGNRRETNPSLPWRKTWSNALPRSARTITAAPAASLR